MEGKNERKQSKWKKDRREERERERAGDKRESDLSARLQRGKEDGKKSGGGNEAEEG